MKNKYVLFLLFLLISGGLYQCKSKEKFESEFVRIDFDKAAVQIMDTLTSQLIGRWNLQQVEFHLKYINSTGSVKKDTVFQNFAILEIQSISREILNRPRCKGQITYNGQLWPVRFDLLADAGRMIEKKGPHAFTLFEWDFPVGSRTWKPEEMFIKNFGLDGENFSIELDNNKNMVWKGLNRDIKEIRMKKI
ncbi:hypothetical protein [Dyadobacter sp. LHD-138]|uniref:hypothetical protein n=1 Tax=Dyadobacter sp. LHD-138 TaxID=3071413 RepID=UPI0027E1371D|nr:hypothetical protein [Dyadobacter sp. LHD-138]MDQ6479439.1 hypothetical protein [Dyadobacter sp. LHD-138]